jgi:Transcription factor Iwr1
MYSLFSLSDVPDLGPDSKNSKHDTLKRAKVEHQRSIFTLALTVDSDEYTKLEAINIQDVYKPRVESRPVSSDSESSGKKRNFSEVPVDAPKFRMSRKKARQLPPEEISKDYVVFDAIREPIGDTSDGVPLIKESGIPNVIQQGNPEKDALVKDMMKSYLTVDHDNRIYVNLKDEYVYDIYYRSAMSPESVPCDSNFGVLVYDSDPELMEDEEEVVDDEDADSNSEGYYQNSYPDEDEWAGEGWGSEEEQDDYGRRREKLGFDSDEDINLDNSEDEVYSYPDD